MEMKRVVFQGIKRLLTSAGLHVQVFSSGKFIPLPLWESNRAFIDIWNQISGHTLVDKRRCFMLYQYACQARTLPGDAAEVGVYRGGTARLLAKTLAAERRIVHLFDTFSGMPVVDPARDLHAAGDFRDTSLQAVGAYLADCPNVRLHAGLFPATAAPLAQLTFSFVHVDVDIYQSVWDCCQFFYPRLAPGGLLVFDDYGMITCPGAKQAVDEFFAEKPEYPCYLPTGQAVVVRIAQDHAVNAP
jgi:O-methyltransferase